MKLTLEQLAQYGGSDPAKPLLLAVCGTILDVSAGGLLLASILCCCGAVRCAWDVPLLVAICGPHCSRMPR